MLQSDGNLARRKRRNNSPVKGPLSLRMPLMTCTYAARGRQIQKDLNEELEKHGIEVEQVLLRSITLPVRLPNT